MVVPGKFTGTAIRAVAAALPASLLVIFAGLIGLVSLLLSERRAVRAEKLMTQMIELAKVIVGIAEMPPEPPTEKPPPVRSLSPPRQQATG